MQGIFFVTSLFLLLSFPCRARADSDAQQRSEESHTNTTFFLKYTNVREVADAFTFIKLPARMRANEKANALLVNATVEQLEQIKSFIEVIDQKNKDWQLVIKAVPPTKQQAFDQEFAFLGKTKEFIFDESKFEDSQYIFLGNKKNAKIVAGWFDLFLANKSYGSDIFTLQDDDEDVAYHIAGDLTFSELKTMLSRLSGKVVISDRRIEDHKKYYFPEDLTKREALLLIGVYVHPYQVIQSRNVIKLTPK